MSLVEQKLGMLVLNGYVAPDPTKYEVTYTSVNGASETLENGRSYIEQTRAQAPSIAVSWTNIEEEDVRSILTAVRPALFSVEYYDQGENKEDIFTVDSPKSRLKMIDGDARWYDLSFTLKG